MTGLTPRQRQGLDFITGYIAAHGYSPSYTEIATALNLKSRSGTFRVVMELEERGKVRTIAGRSRSIVPTLSIPSPADLACLSDDQLHTLRRDLSMEITRRTHAKAIARADEIMGVGA